ncbi:hypothetical protein PR048_005044 [Dryococelus australis]|uniref:Uncharacterized protein n=1 Tax=Dryococelus australis TaxID=614101 RepID=A0ABQ9I856_9NEOP|nr:hypothetical protein PR048_005044 [Dryococelus australis]
MQPRAEGLSLPRCQYCPEVAHHFHQERAGPQPLGDDQLTRFYDDTGADNNHLLAHISSSNGGLLCIPVDVNGQPRVALTDMAAMHNFIAAYLMTAHQLTAEPGLLYLATRGPQARI